MLKRKKGAEIRGGRIYGVDWLRMMGAGVLGKRNKRLEDVEQEQLAQYLDLKGYLWCHPSPNAYRGALARHAPQHAAMRAGLRARELGVKAGVPDALIFERVNEHVGVAIELKVGKNKASPEQKLWIKELSERGWLTHVTNNGSVGAIAFLNEYGL